MWVVSYCLWRHIFKHSRSNTTDNQIPRNGIFKFQMTTVIFNFTSSYIRLPVQLFFTHHGAFLLWNLPDMWQEYKQRNLTFNNSIIFFCAVLVHSAMGELWWIQTVSRMIMFIVILMLCSFRKHTWSTVLLLNIPSTHKNRWEVIFQWCYIFKLGITDFV